MIRKLDHVTILVRDYDEALKFWTEKMGLEVRPDQMFGPGVRWLTVGPKDQPDLEIVLQKPEPTMHGEEGARRMEEQIGKSTTWVFSTDDCQQTYEALSARGVEFTRAPKEQFYGKEAIFKDPYGNSFVLVGR